VSDPVTRILKTSPSSDELAAMPLIARMQRLTRCVKLEGTSYCLIAGFTTADTASNSWKQWLNTLVDQPTSDTGDLRLVDIVQSRAAMSDSERAAAEAAEITQAVGASAKAAAVQALRDGDFAQAKAVVDPGHVAPFACTPSPCGTPTGYSIMDGFYEDQDETNYCGPTTMQMLDWAGDGTKNTQYFIADNWLDTGAPGGSGTSVTSMVSAVNNHTGWDAKAGTYIVQSVSGWSESQFLNTHVGHVYTLQSPIVEHVMLLKKYYGYLNFDHGGHFQPGRGYDTTTSSIRIFEPFDERDFNSSGAASGGAHSVSASNVLAATKADMSNFGL
jgi:hypothetical protein